MDCVLCVNGVEKKYVYKNKLKKYVVRMDVIKYKLDDLFNKVLYVGVCYKMGYLYIIIKGGYGSAVCKVLELEASQYSGTPVHKKGMKTVYTAQGTDVFKKLCK